MTKPSTDNVPNDVMIRINELCNQFEFEWNADLRSELLVRLMTGVDSRYQSVLAAELIALDVELRRESGESVDVDHYAHMPFVDGTTVADILAANEPRSESSSQTAISPDRTDSDLLDDPELLKAFGEYTVLEEIGSGGMGSVYKAIHRRMQRVVAIKILRRDYSRDRRFRERFDREVRAAALLRHENIVTAFDAGEAAGLPFLVTEFIEAKDLSRVVQESGPLNVRDAFDVVRQAATGLRYVHEQGIVHRDVKPGNLLREDSGNVKVLDVGLSRIVNADSPGAQERSDSNLSNGSLMGTVDFMAPEQARDSREADERADIYSLGCTLYYLLTGERCYPGETALDRIFAHREHPIPELKSKYGPVPRSLNTVFRRMLAKQPQDRQQSMAQLIADLEPCRTGFEQTSRAHPNDNPASPPVFTMRRIGIAVALAGVLALVGYEVYRRSNNPVEPLPNPTGRPGRAMTPLSADRAKQLQRAWADYLALSVDLLDPVTGVEFVLIPPGEFPMGSTHETIDKVLQLFPDLQGNRNDREAINSEIPQRRIVISQPFYLATTETTNLQFSRFVTAMNYKTDVESTGLGYGIRNGTWTQGREFMFDWQDMGEQTRERTPQHPVGNLTWADAQAYCHWCSREDIVYRLPTEAEWEFACRAGTQSLWHWGDDVENIDDYAVTVPVAEERSAANPSPVGRRKPNPFGLFDMHGNVGEFCQDAFAFDTYRNQASLIDPVRLPADTTHGYVRRGGSVFEHPEATRASARRRNSPESPSSVGIRLLREIHSPKLRR